MLVNLDNILERDAAARISIISRSPFGIVSVYYPPDFVGFNPESSMMWPNCKYYKVGLSKH